MFRGKASYYKKSPYKGMSVIHFKMNEVLIILTMFFEYYSSFEVSIVTQISLCIFFQIHQLV